MDRLDLCPYCWNTGFRLNEENGRLNECPALGSHEPEKSAIDTVYKSARRLRREGVELDVSELNTAQILANYKGCEPCSLRELCGLLDFDANNRFNVRSVKKKIELLRSKWLLPIGSKKTQPSGYWVITSLREYKDWVKSAASQPITTLSTIHKNARHNFPEFAEQLELEFWDDMKVAA